MISGLWKIRVTGRSYVRITGKETRMDNGIVLRTYIFGDLRVLSLFFCESVAVFHCTLDKGCFREDDGTREHFFRRKKSLSSLHVEGFASPEDNSSTKAARSKVINRKCQPIDREGVASAKLLFRSVYSWNCI
jgi:hypothetical protein